MQYWDLMEKDLKFDNYTRATVVLTRVFIIKRSPINNISSWTLSVSSLVSIVFATYAEVNIS